MEARHTIWLLVNLTSLSKSSWSFSIFRWYNSSRSRASSWRFSFANRTFSFASKQNKALCKIFYRNLSQTNNNYWTTKVGRVIFLRLYGFPPLTELFYVSVFVFSKLVGILVVNLEQINSFFVVRFGFYYNVIVWNASLCKYLLFKEPCNSASFEYYNTPGNQ